MKKHVIIYLPNGKEVQFSTVDLSSVHITLVAEIQFDSENPSVTIVEKDKDGRKSFITYCNIPFQIDSWG